MIAVEVVDQVWWYTSRAAGIMSWVLLSAAVISGMVMSTRDSRRLPAGWPVDLHRLFSTLSLTFLLIHMVALIPDNFVEFGVAELLVPFASTWRPWAVAWGVVALWLVVAVEVSSLLRKRIPNRLWRTIHYASFLVWLSSTIHLFMAGTDVSSMPFRVAQVLMIGAVVTLFLRRLLIARVRSARRPVTASGGGVALPVEESIDVDQVYARKR